MKKFTDRLIEEQRKQNEQIQDLLYGCKKIGGLLDRMTGQQLTGNITQESAGNITHVAFADSNKDAEKVIFYMKKYIELKEVIKNMLDRLDEGAELTLTTDSIIVLALKEAIK